MEYEKIKVRYTVSTESGKERKENMTIDWQGDTPLEAVNAVLKEYSGPRGPRIISIDEIKVNVTPPLSDGEDRRVLYKDSGVIVHNITLGVQK